MDMDKYYETLNDFVRAVSPYLEKPPPGIFKDKIYPYSGLLFAGYLPFVSSTHRDIQRDLWKDKIYFIDLGCNAFRGPPEMVERFMGKVQGFIGGMVGPEVAKLLCSDPEELRAAGDFRRWLVTHGYK